jgi:hypothetical protein
VIVSKNQEAELTDENTGEHDFFCFSLSINDCNKLQQNKVPLVADVELSSMTIVLPFFFIADVLCYSGIHTSRRDILPWTCDL